MFLQLEHYPAPDAFAERPPYQSWHRITDYLGHLSLDTDDGSPILRALVDEALAISPAFGEAKRERDATILFGSIATPPDFDDDDLASAPIFNRMVGRKQIIVDPGNAPPPDFPAPREEIHDNSAPEDAEVQHPLEKLHQWSPTSPRTERPVGRHAFRGHLVADAA